MSLTDQAPDAPQAKPRRRFGFSTQSTLLFVILAISLVASGVVGVIGYRSGRDALQSAALDQLTTIRELRTAELERYFASVENDVSIDSASLMVVSASQDFNEAFEEAESLRLTPAQYDELAAYYAGDVVPELESFTQEDYGDTALIPRSWAGRYLQYYYTAQFTDWNEALAATDAGDGSAWSAARAKYHDHFARLITAEGYEDFLLLDLNGNVVYSAYSGIDLGANLLQAPYGTTKVAQGYEEVLQTGSPNAVVMTDAEFYVASMGRVVMWVLSPVGSTDGTVTGVLAAEIAMYAVGDVMTGNQTWADQGLGETGEVYLVGPDQKMRSISRQYAEDPAGYLAKAQKAGTSPADIAEIQRTESTVLTQSVHTTSVDYALKGDTGTVTNTKEYNGVSSITAFKPLDVGKLDWVVVARIDSSEAFAPAAAFARTLVISLLVIVLAVCLLSLAFAQVFTRPVRRLADAVRAATEGDTTARVPVMSTGEVRDLARAFNDMSDALAAKQAKIEEAQAENSRLLQAVMPESIARRFQHGEDDSLGDEYPDVAVISVVILNLASLSEGRTSAEETQALRLLTQGFDDAAGRLGIERMRSLRGTYLATSGMVTPRVDAVDRAGNFAVELVAVVDRFNARLDTKVVLRIGLATGTVRAGLIDKRTLSYDLWGEAVEVARKVRDCSQEPGIYFTRAVFEHIGDYHTTTEMGPVETLHGTRDVWKIG
ncbi:MAG: HAMP domain-containing protein [Bifidobacteriaceae bacterium]|jgi:class 3 adenylate cyclase|nr:HAMP domain-containing protein [Bifidobacteriaceae bacterium]